MSSVRLKKYKTWLLILIGQIYVARNYPIAFNKHFSKINCLQKTTLLHLIFPSSSSSFSHAEPPPPHTHNRKLNLWIPANKVRKPNRLIKVHNKRKHQKKLLHTHDDRTKRKSDKGAALKPNTQSKFSVRNVYLRLSKYLTIQFMFLFCDI